MAAVVAHEVKNPLAGIRGAVQIIGGRLPADSRDRLMVEEIVARIDSLADLMKDLLTFARPPKPQPKTIDVVRLVHATADLLRQDPAAGNVVVEVEGGAQPLSADPNLLQIVFHNVLANGAQAMKGQGRIGVSIRDDDGLCRIEFADEGPGIPADVREQIFTPFFTTKTRGAGLGLATCRRLVEAHHGNISVECPVQGGTTVIVWLPTSARTARSLGADA
jgi:signal transduction histidine kinase